MKEKLNDQKISTTPAFLIRYAHIYTASITRQQTARQIKIVEINALIFYVITKGTKIIGLTDFKNNEYIYNINTL